MHLTLNFFQSRLAASGSGDLPRAWAIAGRLLLLLNLLVLVLSPLTEQIWTFDRFLRGGEDVEFTLIAFGALCGLVLILARHCRSALIGILYAARSGLRSLLEGRSHSAHSAATTVHLRPHRPSLPSFGTYRIALQI